MNVVQKVFRMIKKVELNKGRKKDCEITENVKEVRN